MKNLPINLDYNTIKEMCQDYGITRLAFFGSVLRADFNENSDVDVLLEYEHKQRRPMYQFYVREELEEMTGRKVDIITVQAVEANQFRTEMKKEILETAEDYYVYE